MVKILISMDADGNVNVQSEGAAPMLLLGLLEVAKDAIKSVKSPAQESSPLVMPRGPFGPLNGGR